MTELEKRVRDELFAMRDEKFRDFNSKLIPHIDKARVIGVRTPELRKYAKALFASGEGREYIRILPHEYFEENNLHAYIISLIPDFSEAMAQTEIFLPYIDNWATCDTFSPKVFKKQPDEVYEKIKLWLKSERTYTVRFGIVFLMANYLDALFKSEMLELIAGIKSDEYYINMAIAWYFSTALAKQYDAALPYITSRRLDPWTHNKAIQKSIESFRISEERKAYLRELKIK